MRRFVTVERHEITSSPGDCAPPGDLRPVPTLSLTVGLPSGGCVLVARAGLADPREGYPRVGHPREGRVLDEHFAVDADVCRERPWLDCADVLYASRPRSAARAERWLTSTVSVHRGCRLAAVPLLHGGWAALVSGDRRVAVLSAGVRGEPSLLPSCLHGWLVSGGSPPELGFAYV